MNSLTIYKWICYAIEIAVVLFIAWNWKEIEARNKDKEADK